eukprot:6831020-Pyramimonas_sp.AAC.1
MTHTVDGAGSMLGLDTNTRGLMGNSQIWLFFGARKYLGGELNSPVAERLKKRLMSVLSP